MTPDIDTLRALVARLEAGEHGQEMSARLVAATLAPPCAIVEFSPFNGAWVIYAGIDSKGRREPLRRLTETLRRAYLGGTLLTSVDAAIAFTKAMLPGFSYEVRVSGFGGVQAVIWNPKEQPVPGYTTRAELSDDMPAPALVLATLKAKLAEVETGE